TLLSRQGSRRVEPEDGRDFRAEQPLERRASISRRYGREELSPRPCVAVLSLGRVLRLGHELEERIELSVGTETVTVPIDRQHGGVRSADSLQLTQRVRSELRRDR